MGKFLKYMLISVLVVALATGSALGVTKVKGKWDSGNLIFYEDPDNRGGQFIIGEDGDGLDLKIFSETTGDYWLFDESAETLYGVGVNLNIDDGSILLQDTDKLKFGDDGDIEMNFTDGTGVLIVGSGAIENLLLGSDTYALNTTLKGTLTVGKDDTGHDVKLFGATSGSYALWDESVDELFLAGASLLVDGYAYEKISTTTESTAGAHTITAAELLGGYYLRDCAGGARTDTTDTAANIVAAIDNAQVGTSRLIFVKNTSDAAETLTIAGGTGVTVTGTATVEQSNTKIFLLLLTNVTGGSEAATLYSIGTLTH